MQSAINRGVMNNIAKDKSEAFALRIVNLYKYLESECKEFVMSKQILRSGTSIGANLAEAECAVSRKDFIAKIYIALKECSETRFWLRLLYKSDYIDQKAFDSIYQDSEELVRILSATSKTLTKGRQNNDE